MCGFGRKALVAMAFVILVVLALPYTAAAATPANDDFDGAKVIASLPFSDSLQDADLSVAGDDPRGCLPGATAWYKLTPSAEERVTFTTSAPNSVALDL
jgi:hypothetical protein